jgi:hypothetical protein
MDYDCRVELRLDRAATTSFSHSALRYDVFPDLRNKKE